jgi:hypothetical protein
MRGQHSVPNRQGTPAKDTTYRNASPDGVPSGAPSVACVKTTLSETPFIIAANRAALLRLGDNTQFALRPYEC